MKVVMPAAYRPEYFRQVVASWEHASWTDDDVMIFRMEPGSDTWPGSEMYEIAAAAKFPHKVHVNTFKLGVHDNPYVSMRRAFEDSKFENDFVILAEDDTVVSNDILDYFRWAARAGVDHPGLLAVCAWSDDTRGDPNRGEFGFDQHWFRTQVWGTYKKTWEEIWEPTWNTDRSRDGRGWDTNLWQLVMQPDNQWHVVYPLCSRSQHIGEVGTHTTSELYDKVIPRASFQYTYPEGLWNR